jgi:hypothetical protein
MKMCLAPSVRIVPAMSVERLLESPAQAGACRRVVVGEVQFCASLWTMALSAEFDTELRELRTAGRPVVLERLGSGQDGRFAPVRIEADVAQCVAALGLTSDHPVLVIVGGAGVMDDAPPDEARRLREQVRRLLDLAVVTSAEEVDAVVLTGGTAQGVMKLVGECFADRGARQLVGVAPRSKIVAVPAEGADIPRDEAVLDANHRHFVLTSGAEWGAETDALFELAECIAGDRRAGAVILANGGAVARHEVKRFLEAGWPVVTLAGTGRAADELADARRFQARRAILRRRRRKQLFEGWGKLETAQLEVHRVALDPIETLNRRLAWYLSDKNLLKNTLGSLAAYENAAEAGRRLTRRVQGLAVGLAATLTGGSLVDGAYVHPDALRWLLVTLPVLVALNGALLDFLLPRRNWMVMRDAAQAVERATYRYRAQCAQHLSPDETDPPLVEELFSIRQRILRSGVRNLLAPPIGRPARLSNAYDELGELTVREYAIIRLDGQLMYYRNAAARLERLQLLTLAGSAVLAAGATWASSEVFAAVWVPVLVLIGATLVIAQQRARWQDRIALYAAALADLQAVRDRQYAAGFLPDLGALVAEVEDALQRENSGWLQSMGRTAADPPPFR